MLPLALNFFETSFTNFTQLVVGLSIDSRNFLLSLSISTTHSPTVALIIYWDILRLTKIKFLRNADYNQKNLLSFNSITIFLMYALLFVKGWTICSIQSQFICAFYSSFSPTTLLFNVSFSPSACRHNRLLTVRSSIHWEEIIPFPGLRFVQLKITERRFYKLLWLFILSKRV